MSKVTIRPGIIGALFSLMMLIAGGYLTNFGIRFLYDSVVGPYLPGVTFVNVILIIFLVLGVTFIGLFFVYVSISLLAQRYVISLEGVYVRRLMKPAFMKWSEVKVIGKAPVLYFHSNYYVLPAQGKGLSLFFSIIDRPKKAAKALLEAAYFSKEAIDIKFDYVNEFGPPPYGIFLDLPEV